MTLIRLQNISGVSHVEYHMWNLNCYNLITFYVIIDKFWVKYVFDPLTFNEF